MHSRGNHTSGKEKCLLQKYLLSVFYCAHLEHGLISHPTVERSMAKLPSWVRDLGMTCPSWLFCVGGTESRSMDCVHHSYLVKVGEQC